ncbi:hypothetical protein BSKO_08771 [Bryopsis sp. KO-2023]|nr:hypothetical protein BSKO_08771 [Bryopsis sp. KO-2023]
MSLQKSTMVHLDNMEAFFKAAKFPCVKHCDMLPEMFEEAKDVCIMAVEKYPNEVEKCTQVIKEVMDKKFGSPWHVVVGKGFSFEITYAVQHILNMFIGGTVSVLVWKM